MSTELILDDSVFRSKELSWLSFNARVLQEAENPDTPLMECVKYLGIYSSNLDEFFRVRVATLKRLERLGRRYRELQIPDPVGTMRRLNQQLVKDTRRFNKAYARVFEELQKHNIQLITEREIPDELKDYLDEYFLHKVKSRIMPISVKASSRLIGLKDFPMYLAVRMTRKGGKGRPAHALVEIPDDLPRFLVLPEVRERRLVMYLDDIIRFGLAGVFAGLPYDRFDAYALKFTRDAEMEFDDDFTESTYDKVTEGIRAREAGSPVRINYDADIPEDFLRMVMKKLRLSDWDTIFPGARYHNRKDLMQFPRLGGPELRFPKLRTIRPPRLSEPTILRSMRRKDILLHFPYHSFDLFIDLLREASLDPLVRSIRVTQYRLARNSAVARALMSAARNGKDVMVMVEPQARFDEEANIRWANAFQEAGIRVILGIAGLKVHAKLCLISRKEKGATHYYSCIGTGNFNENTADHYTDHLLLTADQEIGKDAARIFRYFTNSYQPPALKHLVAAPFSLREEVGRWIENEIRLAKEGKEASLRLKLNNLADLEIVHALYRASEAGVKVRLIVRAMFSVVTEQPAISDNIEAIGIVDRYLEHSRIFICGNGGKPRYFLSSADFLPRNFDSRFEVVCPVYDRELQRELDKVFELQWHDYVKARVLDKELSNRFRTPPEGVEALPVSSQNAWRGYLEEKARPSPG
ncbi:MAG TPA: polyphosphate kinase 1 [Verrucomicrobiales bacterium]|nr:polyphosphate kinase 1 [Verrucomicrobiales bacterium]